MRRLLIANRGEIVVRVARAARALGIVPIGVYTTSDRRSAHVDACDEAFELGDDSTTIPYLDIDRLIEAARATEADAVHPGYGFLAENAAFGARCRDEGLTWVGPGAEVIAAMGDKIEAKRLAEAAGVPTLRNIEVEGGSGSALVDEADLPFPLLIKPAAGGGGKGMHVVERPEDLEDALRTAAREATSSFGDGRLFVERYIPRPHHVEIQVLADTHGTVVHLGERECSIQRRHQKIIEESPSPHIDDQLRTEMTRAALRLTSNIDYVNAGTLEFLVHDDGFAFLEMNTRLQVEHPVTEEVTGLDIVELQLRIARGERLPFAQDDVEVEGHAIEARLYAEDPARGFLPAGGEVRQLHLPPLPGIRYESGVTDGTLVGARYDPMIAKVIARGRSRSEAADRLVVALRSLRVYGLTTNRDLLIQVLDDDRFRAGDTTTAFLEEREALIPTVPPRHEPTHVAVAAVARLLRAAAAARVQHFAAPAWRNVRSQDELVSFRAGERTIETATRPVGGDRWTVRVDDAPRTVTVERVEGDVIVAVVDGVRRRYDVRTDGLLYDVHSTAASVELAEVPRFATASDDATVGGPVAPVPGMVVDVLVAEGELVDAGDHLVIMEAMKMEHRIEANVSGRVAQVLVTKGAAVDAHQVLVVIEPDVEGDGDA